MQSIRYRAHRDVFAVALRTCLLLFAAATAAADPAGIHVIGVGEVEVVPDLARVDLEARREGSDAAALKTELDQVARAVLALTRDLGIAERDVTAAAVNIHPRFQHRDGESVVDGVIATRAFSITLRELDRVADLVNGALARGVNGVNSVALDAANRTALERDALDRAIDDAVRQAEQIATRFRVRLGALVHAGSAPAPHPGPMMRDVMAASMSATGESFAPGEMTIRREISASFAIEPPRAE